MAGEITIRPVRPGDRAGWEPLWQGYLTFYKSTLASEITDATWRRFFDPLERLGAFVAERDGQLIGIAHYLLHRSTWAPLCYCYLEDLFVARKRSGTCLDSRRRNRRSRGRSKPTLLDDARNE